MLENPFHFPSTHQLQELHQELMEIEESGFLTEFESEIEMQRRPTILGTPAPPNSPIDVKFDPYMGYDELDYEFLSNSVLGCNPYFKGTFDLSSIVESLLDSNGNVKDDEYSERALSKLQFIQAQSEQSNVPILR